MDAETLFDDLLDSYGELEIAHEKFCSAIRPGTLGQAKFHRLYSAIGDYERAFTALKLFARNGGAPLEPVDIAQPDLELPSGKILHFRK